MACTKMFFRVLRTFVILFITCTFGELTDGLQCNFLLQTDQSYYYNCSSRNHTLIPQDDLYADYLKYHNLGAVLRVDFSSNRIIMIRKSDFANMSHVIKLYLGLNAISHIVPGAFADLTALKVLDLRNNLLTTVKQSNFNGLVNVRTLHLENNLLQNIKTGTFANLNNLELISLARNNITKFGGAFSNSSRFYAIDLSYNKLTNISNKMFMSIVSIFILTLASNNIEHIDSDAFKELESIHHINLAYNSITMIEPGTFDSLNGLQELNLKHNPLRCNASKNLPTDIRSLALTDCYDTTESTEKYASDFSIKSSASITAITGDLTKRISKSKSTEKYATDFSIKSSASIRAITGDLPKRISKSIIFVSVFLAATFVAMIFITTAYFGGKSSIENHMCNKSVTSHSDSVETDTTMEQSSSSSSSIS